YTVTEDVTFYAQWTEEPPEKYTVIFMSDGEVYKTETVEVDHDLNEPAEPTKDGYKFDGWYEDEDFNNKATFPYMVTEDVTFYAEWTEESPEISYSGGGDAFSGSTLTIQISGGSFERYGANIFIPKDAFGEKIKIKIEKFTNTSGLPIPKNARLASDVIEIIKDKIGDFKKPVTITLRYEKNKYDTAKYDLAIYWLDESKGRWEKLGNISVNEEKGIVEGETEHFTKFAILAVEKDTEQEKPEEPEQFTILLTDIEGHWAEEFIMDLVNLDAIKGYPDNTFKPNNNITRAEFATALVRAFSPETKSDRVFADTKNHWAKDFIATAAANSIVLGYDENTFGPDDLITREQMAVMITRVLKISSQDSNIAFADKENISAWAKDSVAAAAEKGIIEGYPDNTFKPLGKATRAEAVTVIVKALQ
ncbi:MAG: S-layer homology domain-containing protein, partial [Alkaliphilus sp.]|nr:S-layer homology domain-containing protein [Alkaliphilus sp.]